MGKDRWDDASPSEILACARRLRMQFDTADLERRLRGEPSARFNRILVDSTETEQAVRDRLGDKLDGIPIGVSAWLSPGTVLLVADPTE